MMLSKGESPSVYEMDDIRKNHERIERLLEELGQAILLYLVRTVENCPSSRVDVFGAVVTTTIQRQSGQAVDRKFLPNLFTLETDRRSVESSRISNSSY